MKTSYCILLLLATPVNFSYFKIIKARSGWILFSCFNRFSQPPKLITDMLLSVSFWRLVNSFEVLVNWKAKLSCAGIVILIPSWGYVSNTSFLIKYYFNKNNIIKLFYIFF